MPTASVLRHPDQEVEIEPLVMKCPHIHDVGPAAGQWDRLGGCVCVDVDTVVDHRGKYAVPLEPAVAQHLAAHRRLDRTGERVLRGDEPRTIQRCQASCAPVVGDVVQGRQSRSKTVHSDQSVIDPQHICIPQKSNAELPREKLDAAAIARKHEVWRHHSNPGLWLERGSVP